MSKICTTILFLAFCQTCFSQPVAPPEGFSVSLIQDNIYGFEPSVVGIFPISKRWSFSFYGNFWTNPYYGTASSSGNDLWLETGIGLATKLANDHLFLNPSLGLTNGKVLSGGSDGVFGDGIVPNVFSYFRNGNLEAEFFATYYKSLQKRGPTTSDNLQIWLLPGVFLNKNVSHGIHYELNRLTRITDGHAQNLYQVVGLYVKFMVGERHWLRFSAGKNFVERDKGGFAPSFYRLTVGITLL